eukprot:scaffold71307_cov63-Phaeocystis_antarctica.AAC.1
MSHPTSDRFVRNVLPEPRGSVRVIRVALSIPSPWHMLGDGHSTYFSLSCGLIRRCRPSATEIPSQ